MRPKVVVSASYCLKVLTINYVPRVIGTTSGVASLIRSRWQSFFYLDDDVDICDAGYDEDENLRW